MVAVAGTAHGKIRAMFNDHGEPIKVAAPSTPVTVLGLSDVPSAGDTFRGSNGKKPPKPDLRPTELPRNSPLSVPKARGAAATKTLRRSAASW